MNQDDRSMSTEKRVERSFMADFKVQILWLVVAVAVIAVAGLFVLSPWSDDESDDPTAPALSTPPAAGTPNP